MRATDAHWPPSDECPNDVRNKLILRPISPANDIPRSCARNFHPCRAIGTKIGFSESSRDQLGTGFAARVRIMSTERFVLPIAPDPVLVLVALVTGNIHNDAREFQLPDCLKQVHRT